MVEQSAADFNSLTKTIDGWIYTSPSGRKYDLAELKVPNSLFSYDVAVLMDYDADDVEDYEFKFVNYFFGITTMSDSELIEVCRGYVEQYEEKFKNRA